MCGRVYVRSSAIYDILLSEMGITDQLPTLLNVAPTQEIPVIRQDNQLQFSLSNMRWWLHPAWSASPPSQDYAMFNARIETILTSKAFKGPILGQRAIIPVAGFIEWKTVGKTKTPYYIETEDGSPLLFAGIWDNWRDQVYSCSIVTQPADENFKEIHSRMPLSLTVEEAMDWLNPRSDGKELVSKYSGCSLALRPREILPTINNARNKVDVTYIE